MPRGPLPNPQRRRRNAPEIPTTNLPAAGRSGPAPRPPKPYKLGAAGAAWWKWAWKTPQAAGWDAGALYVIARRARLEDDLALVKSLDAIPLDLAELLGVEDLNRKEVFDTVKWTIGALKGLAAGSLAIMKEARELEKVLGLTPKAKADLRWTITEEDESTRAPATTPATLRRLRAVDPEAATGS